jgi:hypothetical protein
MPEARRGFFRGWPLSYVWQYPGAAQHFLATIATEQRSSNFVIQAQSYTCLHAVIFGMARPSILPATDAAGSCSVIVIDALIIKSGIESFKEVGKIEQRLGLLVWDFQHGSAWLVEIAFTQLDSKLRRPRLRAAKSS